MAPEMARAVSVLGAVDAAGPEPVEPIRTAEREVDADPMALPAVLDCDLSAEQVEFFHGRAVPGAGR